MKAVRLVIAGKPATKNCKHCGVEQSLSDYSPARESKDGHKHTCKACNRLARRHYYAEHTEAQRESGRRYYRRRVQQEGASFRAAAAASARRYYRQNTEAVEARKRDRMAAEPDKTRARRLLRTAVLNGSIREPERCEACEGIGRVEAHHADYSKPLEVAWLCVRCHRQAHSRYGAGWDVAP